MVVTQFPLQRAQEIQQVLLVGWRERIKFLDYRIGFRTQTVMRSDSLQQVAGAPVVKEKHPLS